MAFRFTETRRSRSSGIRPPTQTLEYRAAGSNDEDFVRGYAMANSPPTVSTQQGTLYRQNINLRPVGFQIFDVSIPYAKEKREAGKWTFDFDTSGGTVHITTRIGPHQAKAPANAEDAGAIGERGDQIDGVDIVIPAMLLNVTFQHPLGEVTMQKVRDIFNATGKVNSKPFLGFDAGEVLCLGGRGSDGSEAEASVSYQFAISPNDQGIKIGDLDPVAKRGHDYLWVKFKPAVNNGEPIQEPIAVYVDQVYKYVDLAALLGFGE